MAVCFNMAADAAGETGATGIYWINDSILLRCLRFFVQGLRMLLIIIDIFRCRWLNGS